MNETLIMLRIGVVHVVEMNSDEHLTEVQESTMLPIDGRMSELYDGDNAHYEQKKIGDTIVECCYRTCAGGRVTVWEPIRQEAPDILKEEKPLLDGSHRFPYRKTFWDWGDAWEWYTITLTDEDGVRTFKQLTNY